MAKNKEPWREGSKVKALYTEIDRLRTQRDKILKSIVELKGEISQIQKICIHLGGPKIVRPSLPTIQYCTLCGDGMGYES